MNVRPPAGRVGLRLTARARIALLHTGIVAAAGAGLVGLTYLLVRHGLANSPRFLLLTGRSGQPATTGLDEASALAVLERAHADTLSQMLTQSTVALAVVVSLAAVSSWLVAGRILRPVRAIASTARRLATAELSTQALSRRVPVTAPADELAALAEAVNDMLDRIQSGLADRDRLLASQRMFVANAAHELRTPLTTIRTALEVTLDGEPDATELRAMTADISAAVDHSSRTIDGLLALAHSQTGPTRWEPVDLAATRGAEAGVRLDHDLCAAPVDGDPVLLERMVANLVDNALRYNRPGGAVAVATGTAGGRGFLRVTNTGEAPDPESTERLWEPFVRGQHDRHTTGAGLGLSIVRAVAHAHAGTAHATPDADGLTILITLAANRAGHPTQTTPGTPTRPTRT
jgi:signal transduction histidine kinase